VAAEAGPAGGRARGGAAVSGITLGELSEPLSGRVWSDEAARAHVRRRAAHLGASGVEPGDLVFVHFGNCLEFFADLLAIWQAGACAAPIDPRLTPFEVETLARAAAPRFSLWPGWPPAPMAAALGAGGVALLESLPADADSGGRPAPEALGRWELDRDALVLFTSGSTGEPKGVVHTHRSLRARWASLREHVGLRSVRRTLCLLPTHFGHGLICNALFPWLSGQQLAVLPPFRADVILHLGALLDEHRITFMSSVPALWRVGLRTARPPRARTLERVFCGSAPLSAAMWRDVRAWTGAAVSNVYGITETASWLAGTATGATPEDGLVGELWGGRIAIGLCAEGTDGPPTGPGMALPPGEPGRIWVSTPALMRGYLGRDDLTALAVRDGWLGTGDIGCLDGRGRLHLSGREREEINRGGLKVYPGDVDAVIERCEAALDGCAFGYDDGLGQEDVGVAVVVKPGDGAAMRRVYDWARRHLAPHQLPRRWYAVDEIPRTSRGKLNRAQVAARCATLRPVDLRTISGERAKATAGAVRPAGGPGPAGG